MPNIQYKFTNKFVNSGLKEKISHISPSESMDLLIFFADELIYIGLKNRLFKHIYTNLMTQVILQNYYPNCKNILNGTMKTCFVTGHSYESM